MNPNPDDSVAYPPRFWWLKRILIASGILLVLLAGLRLGWGWYASRQLQAEIERIVARGEPIYPEDFDPKEEIPDDENAAKLLLEASSMLDLSDEQEQAFFAVFDHDKPITNHVDVIHSIYVDNADAFALIREARELGQYDWGIRIRSPVSSSMPFSFNEFRVLCKLLCLRAEIHHVRNEDSGAIASLLDNLGLARIIATQPTLIAQMVAWAISEMGVGWIERFAIPTAEDAKDVDPAIIRELIHELLDDRTFHERLVRAFEVERMGHLDLLRELESGRMTTSGYFALWAPTPHARIPDWIWRYGLGPRLRLDMVRVLQKATRQVDAIHREDFGHPDLAIEEENEVTLSDVLREPFGNWVFFHRAVHIYLRCEARRQLTAVGLALRLFRADHGSLPKRLEELVPAYLDALPKDPQSREARTFGYRPDASLPVVYGVGDDGVDDGGDVQEKKTGTKRARDLFFFLNGDRPMPKPDGGVEQENDSAEAPKDNGDTEEEKRQNDETEAQEKSPEDRQQ